MKSTMRIAAGTLFSVGILGILATSCSVELERSVVLGGDPESDAAGVPILSPSDLDSGTDAERRLEQLLCIATECPSPYATCASAGKAGYKCGTNLLTDDQNCGGCGNVCPGIFGPLQMATHCIDGRCERECQPRDPKNGPFFEDCNGRVEDGCEIIISTDPENCGACGNKCMPGVRCIDGKCGCPPGKTDCNGQCVDTRSDVLNCGQCSNRCTEPGPMPTPPNTAYGCVEGQCKQLRCSIKFQQLWADCNGSLDPDGCEINLATDVNNCGACGYKCGPGQICRQLGADQPKCLCAPNEAICGSEFFPVCADLQTNPDHCGTCEHRCPGAKWSAGDLVNVHGAPACRKGFCAYECEPGYADCDDDIDNGCETNLMVNGANCGACGKRCDVAAGQPCVDGKCLMKACNAQVPQ